ncbi:uncharacterized protein LOC106658078 [Trichogramma pretiosum]|uniref:uncharacterized protein LOC106658078 n=1 Tax=Trichogramma pretiosum TaxID=7493 RepID=UPI000C718B55|nr:uncharacterized protein LOC106658078 [Trichogramma pretiosum]
MIMSPFLTICAALLFLNSGVEALHCFECNSHIDSRCAEGNLPDALKKDCSEHVEGAKYTMCRKIKQVIEFSVNGLPADTRVIRSCAWDESNYKGKCYQRGGFGGRQEVCSCTNDFCNSGSSIAISAYMFIALLLNYFFFIIA